MIFCPQAFLEINVYLKQIQYSRAERQLAFDWLIMICYDTKKANKFKTIHQWNDEQNQ